MTTTTNATHEDYADEAQRTELSKEWSKAASLWRRAAEACRDADQVSQYRNEAARCDGEIRIDEKMADIARRVLSIPTLESRKSDSLDFHEVSVGSLLDALRMAYREGRDQR